MANRAHRWKGDDTPLTGVHGGTLNAALRAVKDAKRYAEWERRGCPPSPPPAPRKDRLRPKRGRGNIRARLYEAQNGLCGICGFGMGPCQAQTIDHVVPRARGGKNAGNVLLAHSDCNSRKGDRAPTTAERATLAKVNARLGLSAPPPSPAPTTPATP